MGTGAMESITVGIIVMREDAVQRHKHPQQHKHHTVHPDGCTVRTVHLEFVSELSGCAMELLTAHKAGMNSDKTVQRPPGDPSLVQLTSTSASLVYVFL